MIWTPGSRKARTVKKAIKIARLLLMFVLLIAAGIYYYLNVDRKLELSGEQEVYSERTTFGKFWHVITSDDGSIRFMKKYNVKLPQKDFQKN
jgi:hypothetical protein